LPCAANADGVGDEFAGGFLCHGDREISDAPERGKPCWK
jgi:hypothetical protein